MTKREANINRSDTEEAKEAGTKKKKRRQEMEGEGKTEIRGRTGRWRRERQRQSQWLSREKRQHCALRVAVKRRPL